MIPNRGALKKFMELRLLSKSHLWGIFIEPKNCFANQKELRNAVGLENGGRCREVVVTWHM